MAKLEIKLVRSKIGRIEKHKRTLEAMGLRKIGDTIVREDTPQIRGMINQVAFMLDVNEVK